MAFRFLHTADLHLDSPLKALALRDPDLARELGVASRGSFSRIIDLCIEEEVAFLLIAGDLWDGTHSSTKTPRFLKQELLRLERAGIACFLIRGNHDAMAKKTAELELPANTRLFDHKPASVLIEASGHQIAIHGHSFREEHVQESAITRYPAPVAGAFNIGMMHTSLNGSAAHDPYAPCSVAALEAQGYDYWALGHIHLRQVHGTTGNIVMPGNPQGRDIGEAGPRSVTLVDVADDNSIRLQARNVASLRFDRLPIDCSGAEDWAALIGKLETALQETAQNPRDEAHLVLRPVLTGQTATAWRATRDHDVLLQEAQSFASQHGIWIDKLELRLQADAAQNPAGLAPELLDIMRQDPAQDPQLMRHLLAELAGLKADLPPELRDAFGADPEEEASLANDLLKEGMEALLAHLHAGDQ